VASGGAASELYVILPQANLLAAELKMISSIPVEKHCEHKLTVCAQYAIL